MRRLLEAAILERRGLRNFWWALALDAALFGVFGGLALRSVVGGLLVGGAVAVALPVAATLAVAYRWPMARHRRPLVHGVEDDSA